MAVLTPKLGIDMKFPEYWVQVLVKMNRSLWFYVYISGTKYGKIVTKFVRCFERASGYWLWNCTETAWKKNTVYLKRQWFLLLTIWRHQIIFLKNKQTNKQSMSFLCYCFLFKRYFWIFKTFFMLPIESGKCYVTYGCWWWEKPKWGGGDRE